MKKAQKTMIFILCGALCAVLLACASGGGSSGGGAAAGGVVEGTWEWVPTTEFSDGNDSTCFVEIAEEVIDGETVQTVSIHGTVTATAQYGESQSKIIPDEATLELLRTCTAISFKVLGDGRNYILRMPTKAVTDWGFHMNRFNTTQGEVEEIFLPIRSFRQPDWAAGQRFYQNQVELIEFTTRNNAEGGLGDWAIKIWDFKLHF